jgi:hypothetical protein
VSSLPNPGCQRSATFSQVLQNFLLAPGLPFASILDADKIERTLNQPPQRAGTIYSHAMVLWAFLSQVLRDGKEASCQSAVARIVAHRQKHGLSTPTSDTGDYCRARSKLSETALKELSCQVADDVHRSAPASWRWKNRCVKLIDGFTFMMPDTPENQKAYPQHVAQKPGIGFPIARCVGLICLATGALLAATLGPFQGKQTGETSLFRRLLSFLCQGDVVVADRYFCNYWMVALMIQLKVDVCFRNSEPRSKKFTCHKRLGKADRLVKWNRPTRKPAWMTQKMFDDLPKFIVVREIRYNVTGPGRKLEPFVVITTLTESEKTTNAQATGVSVYEIADLFSFRWNAELDIRSIKTHMNLHHVRCKSPAMVHREFWTTMLAYNLIRTTMATSAIEHDITPRQISFVSACQYVLAGWQVVGTLASRQAMESYIREMLNQISECEVAKRPGRLEPRVIKKRRDRYSLMTQPRHELINRLLTRDNSFED